MKKIDPVKIKEMIIKGAIEGGYKPWNSLTVVDALCDAFTHHHGVEVYCSNEEFRAVQELISSTYNLPKPMGTIDNCYDAYLFAKENPNTKSFFIFQEKDMYEMNNIYGIASRVNVDVDNLLFIMIETGTDDNPITPDFLPVFSSKRTKIGAMGLVSITPYLRFGAVLGEGIEGYEGNAKVNDLEITEELLKKWKKKAKEYEKLRQNIRKQVLEKKK